MSEPPRKGVTARLAQAGVWFQKCYDADCRGYRSAAMPLPPAALAAAQAALPAPVHPAPVPAARPTSGCGAPGGAAGPLDPGSASEALGGPAGTPARWPGLAGGAAGGRAGPAGPWASGWAAGEDGEEAGMVAALDALDAGASPAGAAASGPAAGGAPGPGGGGEQDAAMLAALERAEASACKGRPPDAPGSDAETVCYMRDPERC